MKRKYLFIITCLAMLISVPVFEQNGFAASVETVGELKTSGGIRFNDNSLQTKACSGCANGILAIILGGTGGDTSSEARTNLAVPGLATPNTFTTDQTVAGTVDATSFSGSGSGLTFLNASSLASGTVPDERLPTNLARKYGKVVVVAKSGGDYTSPVAAMAGVASWCGTPSENNTCLLKIMPGVYDLGSGSLTMQQYVDIEGAGENATVIKGAVSSASSPPGAVVNGASYAELRFLTVMNTGTGAYVAAVRNSSASPRMTHMTAAASGGTYRYGVYNYNSSSPAMSNVTATASRGRDHNFGVYNSSSPPTMNNVTATATGGTSNYGLYNHAGFGAYTIKIDRSTFSGSTNSIRNDTEFTIRIGATNLTGGAVLAGGTFNCVGVYDGDTYTTLNATCQ
jgi:hypothetical protein